MDVATGKTSGAKKARRSGGRAFVEVYPKFRKELREFSRESSTLLACRGMNVAA
jgi:ribosomal protein L19E